MLLFCSITQKKLPVAIRALNAIRVVQQFMFASQQKGVNDLNSSRFSDASEQKGGEEAERRSDEDEPGLWAFMSTREGILAQLSSQLRLPSLAKVKLPFKSNFILLIKCMQSRKILF